MKVMILFYHKISIVTGFDKERKIYAVMGYVLRYITLIYVNYFMTQGQGWNSPPRLL